MGGTGDLHDTNVHTRDVDWMMRIKLITTKIIGTSVYTTRRL